MKEKENKGITLIALVITIIVLLILAGVTLSTLFSNNGILKQSQSAVLESKLATAKEEVQMAWTSCQTEYIAAWTKDNSVNREDYFTQDKLDSYTSRGTIESLSKNEDGTYTVKYRPNDEEKAYTFLVDEDGNITTKTGVILEPESLELQIVDGVKGSEKINVTLEEVSGTVNWNVDKSDVIDLEKASDGMSAKVTAKAKGEATITVTCGGEKATCPVIVKEVIGITGITKLEPATLEVKAGQTATITATITPENATEKLEWSSKNDNIAKVTSISEDGKTATITGIAEGNVDITATSKSGASATCPVTVKVAYLVDNVEIGDYVDIGITYTNQGTFYPSYTVGNTSYPSTGMTGWRVLSKTGNVTLVAAGCPLKFYHPSNQASTSIPMLEDLKKEITIVGSSTQGFTQNGFSSNNLKSIFESCSYIDTTKSIHAFGCSTNYTDGTGTKTTAYSPLDEIETAYEALTGSRKTIKELNGMSYPLKTGNMKSANPSMSTKAYDLLGNGFTYWLGGASYSANYLWAVGFNGLVSISISDTYGVRPVVSLKSGVKIAESNSGDGSSESAAYTISF